MKPNDNPFSLAERAVAEEIRRLPEVSGAESGEPVSVFAFSEENFTEKLQSAVAQATGQCICVFADAADAPNVHGARLSARLAVSVEISANGVLTDAKRTSTSDLAVAVIRGLDGVAFEYPFTPDALRWQSSSVADDNGLYVHALRFSARIVLR